jgi:Protein of unknown function (DUF2946)
VRRLGHWLAILAIALHAAWPLLANARPKSVHLVPLCTVEGITHYLEVPGGNSPLDDSANAHHDHCAFCFLGAGAPLLSSHAELRLPCAAASERVASGTEGSPISTALIVHGARAPPLSSVVTHHHNNFRGQDETNLFAGRAARAPYG